MAKDLPYFKFDAAEWINGNITLEDFYLQGVFINVCAYYWFKLGDLKLTEVKRRLTNIQPTALNSLIESGLLHIENDKLRIGFLDEQLAERTKKSAINSENGRKGGAPKGNNNNRKSTESQAVKSTQSQPKLSNIEEKRREEREKYTHGKGKLTITIRPVFTHDPIHTIHDLKEYYKNTGQLDSLEEIGLTHFEPFMKENSGKMFNEPDHLYNTFRNFCKEYKPPVRAPNKFTTAEVDKENLTPEAWEQMYAWDLKNNEEFKLHFNGKFSPSQSMGINN